MQQRECRALRADFKIERSADGAPLIVGYAARFNEVTTIGAWFRERIAPGAFAEVIKGDDVRALFNHDPNKVLGRTKSGTLRMFEDEVGLRYEVTPPDTQDARDLIALLERGDVSGSSFSFLVADDGDEWDDEGDLPMRTIRRFSALYDVGPATFPAYPTTSAGARSAEDVRARFDEARKRNEKNKSEASDRKARLMQLRLDLLALE